ncbi:ferredoxin [Sphingorhabdus sp.]|jgi:ferredoxin|uniref:ferredoxin n=1 Tax=Sphingorhabdus sp. TaxID=1902408 RepID=UPI002637F0E8|nr:ferredoxin [Sphingorhabdus sp.]MDH4399832.1 ferredoxin [Sphingorhabdus sp.]
MRVKIDGEHCTGHGRCAKYAPNVFILDDDGYNADRGNEIDVPAGEEENAKRGMKSCPERAITLVAE